MMYLKFTTAQLNEYKKIIDTLNSSTTTTHHAVVMCMLENFAKMCDYRKKMLRKNAWIKLFGFNNLGMREYKLYTISTSKQIDNLINYCKHWREQYTLWEDEMLKEAEENKNSRGEKVNIVGFSKLLKRKRMKK